MNRTRLPILAALLAVLAVGIALVRWAPRTSTPASAFPTPNGSDDFRQAGRLLVPMPTSRIPTNQADLKRYVTTNAESLRLIREGLAKECRIGISWGSGANQSQQHLDELALLKHLAWVLEAHGRLAEMEGDTNRAARIHLETIRLGNESVRGGVGIDKLIGLAIEALGVASLERLRDHLDTATREEVVRGLQRIEERRESAAEVLRQEREWRRANFSLYVRVITSLPVPALNPTRRLEQNLTAKISQQKLRQERLATSLKD